MVTVRQLEYFVRVVEEDSFTGAASALFVSQPGLSHQIRALETGLGGPLLERTPRGVLLTPLGREVLPHARAAVADVARVREAADRVVAGSGGSLDVATITSISLGVLPGVLGVWRAVHPEVTVRVHEFSSVGALLAALDEGVADIAVTPLPEDWSGVRRLVGVEEFVVVVSPDHRLAAAGRITVALEELAEDVWVHFNPGHGLGDVLDRVARQHGFEPRVAMRTAQAAAAPLFAAAGAGAALIPANTLGPAFPGHVLRPDPPIHRNIYVIGRGQLQPPAQAFAATVRTSAELTPPWLLATWAGDQALPRTP